MNVQPHAGRAEKIKIGEILFRERGALVHRAMQERQRLLRIARAAAAVDRHVRQGAHRLGVAGIDGGAKRRRDLALVGFDRHALVPAVIELERRNHVALLRRAPVPARGGIHVARESAVAVIEEFRERDLRVALARGGAAHDLERARVDRAVDVDHAADPHVADGLRGMRRPILAFGPNHGRDGYRRQRAETRKAPPHSG